MLGCSKRVILYQRYRHSEEYSLIRMVAMAMMLKLKMIALLLMMVIKVMMLMLVTML